jgi:ABC-type phosphate transport system substrate-binding protein
MKKSKFLAGSLCLATALLSVGSAFGQSARPQVVGVGSSALFPAVSIAALNGDPITGAAACGSNIWTGGGFVSGVAMAAGVDPRLTSNASEPGNISIVWDNSTTPQSVCAYLSVDSVVGQRLFFAQATTSSNSTGVQNGFISLNAAATTTKGANKVTGIVDTNSATPTCDATGQNPGTGSSPCGLPTAVFNIVQSANFNVAFTDIRPEDGIFATNRAGCAPANPGSTGGTSTCLGYKPGLYAGGQFPAVLSSYNSTSIANIVPYGIPVSPINGSASAGTYSFGSATYGIGVDPINTSLAIPATFTIGIGASPVLVIANTSDATLAAITNMNSHSLSQLYSGYAGFVGDLNGGIAQGNGINIIQREPTSGTYNTFEWQVVRSRDTLAGNSQELSVAAPSTSSFECFTPGSSSSGPFPLPTTICQNPLFNFGFKNTQASGTRTRAIGTGEMVTAVSSNADALGYAFWGLGSFIGKNSIKYFTVDGVDPLYATYIDGTFPATCTGIGTASLSCTHVTSGSWPLPNFANILNGGYRVWSILRAVHDKVPPTYQQTTLTGSETIDGLIQAAQDQAFQTSTVNPRVPDFVPYIVCNSGSTAATCSATAFTFNLPVFRSHSGQSGIFPSNGIRLNPPTATTNPGLSALTGLPEAGEDMNGAVVPVQAAVSYINFGGNAFESKYFNVQQ